MIIELRRTKKLGELLIGKRTTGLQAQVNYRDMVQRAYVTRRCPHGGEKTGMRTGNRDAYKWPPSGIENRYMFGTAEQLEEHLACNKIEIVERKEGWDLRSQVHWLSGQPMRWCGWRVLRDRHMPTT